MQRIIYVALLASGMCIWSFAYATAQDRSGRRLPLRGLDSVDVVVETLSSAATQAGLSRQSLVTTIERELRRGRVRTWHCQDCEGGAYLYLNINVLEVEAIEAFIYNISLRLKDDVRRLNQREIVTAVTWDAGTLGVVSTADPDASGYITSQALRLLARFLDDYLAANPRGQ